MTDNFAERVTAARAAGITPRQAEMRRAGEAIRRIIDKFVATKAPIDELSRAADTLDGVAGALAAWPQGRVFEGFAESANAGDPYAFFDHSPIMGMANPLAPPVRISVEDTTVVGQVVFGAAYEGPPGCVHGGYLAAAFDEVLGMAQSLRGNPGMTGTLTIRYRQPTPLHQELRFEGELGHTEGRKTFTVGRCFAGGALTAEADAVFISVDFDQIAERYGGRPAASGDDA